MTEAGRRRDSCDGDDRGQSNVVGVAILLGVVVVSLGTLTAGIGTVVEQNAASADATRVASDFDAALAPVETTGVHRDRVTFTEGQLDTVKRDLRVLNESGILRTIQVDALVFTAGDRRVAFLAGAILRGSDDAAQMRTPPPITASRSGGTDGVLVVGAPELNGSVGLAASGGGSVLVRTRVSHRRVALGNATYRVAVETTTPGAWRRYFDAANASTALRDFDDDGVPSVVASYPGKRVGYLVVHEIDLEVTYG